MKKMKKLASLVLALAMALTLAVPAMAAGPFTVTIENADGHTYQIYQIFTGDLAEKDGKDVLSNIKYGADYTPGEVKVGDTVPEEDLKNFNQTNIQPTDNGTAMTTNGNTAAISGLVAGYYMIKDVTEMLPDGETHSAVIFQVVGDTTIASKHSGVTIVKKVKDINDSEETVMTDWQDSADHDIGDTVPFQSTATFTGLSAYTTYKVVFTDTMSAGLAYNNDMAVQMDYTYIDANGDTQTGSKNVTSSFEPVTVAEYSGKDGKYQGGKVYTLTNDNIKDLVAGVNISSATFTLTYSATLDTDAKHGAPGNPNKIKVSYKADNDVVGETPEDTVIVFTYKVIVNKTDENGADLAGAMFTLEKFVAKAEGTETYNGVKGNWVAKDVAETDPNTTFTFEGLDDGVYRLTETETPAGYNSINPIVFTVTAGHDILADNPSLQSLSGDKVTGEVEIKFTPDTSAGSLTTAVKNQSGATLPETGGMGTTLFYALGAVLVIGAGVALVTKKRMA